MLALSKWWFALPVGIALALIFLGLIVPGLLIAALVFGGLAIVAWAVWFIVGPGWRNAMLWLIIPAGLLILLAFGPAVINPTADQVASLAANISAAVPAASAPTATPATVASAPLTTTTTQDCNCPSSTPVDDDCPPNDGTCWSYASNKTMTWTGAKDGSCDIQQAVGDPLNAIRCGSTAVFVTTVPGEMIITVGTVDGKSYTSETKFTLPAGTHTVTGSIGDSGGFRWTPCPGYGWRK